MPQAPPPPPSSPPPPSPLPAALARQDPHLQFADGGRADFRGADREIFCFLSSRNLTVNAKIGARDFMLGSTLVHGTFITEIFVRAVTTLGRTLRIFTQTIPAGALYVDELSARGALQQQYFLGHRASRTVGDVDLRTKELSVSVRTSHWEVAVAVRPIFGALRPGQKRLDLSIRELAVDAAVAPHGLVGQAFDHDDVGVDGAQDQYAGSEFTTQAQAEGAIEGSWEDYRVAAPFDADFRFSRFGRTSAPPRNVSSLSGRRIFHAPMGLATAS